VTTLFVALASAIDVGFIVEWIAGKYQLSQAKIGLLVVLSRFITLTLFAIWSFRHKKAKEPMRQV